MPRLTRIPIDTKTVRQHIATAEQHGIDQIKQTGGYKIMQMVGCFACQSQWNDSLGAACYRAARQLHISLQQDEADVLEELHSRIVTNRNQEEVHAVMATWAELQRYREDWLSWPQPQHATESPTSATWPDL